VAGCGGTAATARPATVSEVRTAVEEWLLAKPLSFKWVHCLRTRLEFDGADIFRCNVNFGPPHIVIYCATLEDGELITNRDEPAIRCGRGSGA
jgi:hypothetical protein